MDAAVAAAASADDLTVAIGNGGVDDTDDLTDDRDDVNDDKKMDANDAPQVGDNKVTLYFSDIVVENAEDDPALTNTVRDILEINSAPARDQHGQPGHCCERVL